jgi:hypothetical protein
VTASGGGFPTATQQVTIGTVNLKLDFAATGPLPTAPVDQLASWNGFWRIDLNGSNTWDGAGAGDRFVASFGGPGNDVPLAMDWDGDGQDELAFFRRGTDLFVDTNNDGVWTKGQDVRRRFGNGGDQLIVADFGGDSSDDVGLFRNETRRFHLDSDGDGVLEAGDAQFEFLRARATDIALAGDWNGDGSSDIGLFRLDSLDRANFYLDLNNNRRWDGSTVDRFVRLGRYADSTPVVGNYDTDPMTEIAVYSRSRFRIDSDGNGRVDRTIAFAGGVVGVPGQWSS